MYSYVLFQFFETYWNYKYLFYTLWLKRVHLSFFLELRQREADSERRKWELEKRQIQYQEPNFTVNDDFNRPQNQMPDNFVENDAINRRQHQMLDPVINRNLSFGRQEMPMFSPKNFYGFGGTCDYNDRSSSFDSDPFVVFPGN